MSDYRLAGTPITLDWIEDDASGITFNPDSRTLFVVVNSPALLFELSLEGVKLRRIRLRGFRDTEGVTYLGEGYFAVVEERRSTIVLFKVGARTRMVRKKNEERLALHFPERDNKGLEGIAADSERQVLFLAKEKWPRRLLQVAGVTLSDEPFSTALVSDLKTPPRLPGDLAGLHFEPVFGHLLIVSDDSRLVLEVSPQGEAFSSLQLRPGVSGLRTAVPQAEGVTMDDQGRLYVLSEPNHLYRFDPPDAIRGLLSRESVRKLQESR